MEQYKKSGVDVEKTDKLVNDIICTGASPMFFLDYYASSKINESDYKTIISSIKTGCDISNMSLIGGETAELPGMINGDHFDIAGFCLGKVKKKHLINNYHSKIKHGDLVLGFQSSGFHSNGFSLIRKIFFSSNFPNNSE